MSKSPDAFRTIREVADWLGVAAHVLRYWESQFSQIRPVKRAGGRRYYRPSDMEFLGGLKVLLHDRGMTIRGAKKFIRDEGVATVAALSPPLDVVAVPGELVEGIAETEAEAWEADAAAETAPRGGRVAPFPRRAPPAPEPDAAAAAGAEAEIEPELALGPGATAGATDGAAQAAAPPAPDRPAAAAPLDALAAIRATPPAAALAALRALQARMARPLDLA